MFTRNLYKFCNNFIKFDFNPKII